MLKKNTFIPIVLAFVMLFIIPGGVQAASEPDSYTIGETRLNLKGPANHVWVNKKSVAALMIVPDRYKGLTRQLLSIYSSGSTNSFSKMYNNHGALFFVGSPKKVWTNEDFTFLKTKLMPTSIPGSDAETLEREQFLRDFLAKNAAFEIPGRKAKKYYGRLLRASVLYESDTSVILAYRHKKKGEKDKFITLSLALVQDKLIGTAYYQVDPDKKERERAAQMTIAWQKSILQANHSLAGKQ